MTNANRTCYVLIPSLKNQSVLRAKIVKVCKILIRPVAKNGEESWTLNKNINKRLDAF
jgi:hypothetical protein